MTRISYISALFAACTLATASYADEAVLYDEAAPDDAVFVRVLSELAATASSIPFAGVDLTGDAATADTYLAISAADLTGVEAGMYYSLAKPTDGDVPLMIAEPARETSAKVHLILVNTSDAPVRLVVAGQNAEVIAPQDTGMSASRAVNPVSASLAVERTTDSVILAKFDVQLARGQNLTFVANDDTARLLENNFGPVLTLN